VRPLRGARLTGSLIVLILVAGTARAAEITVMTSGGFTAPLLDVIPLFEGATPHTVVTVFGASGGGAPDSIPERLARGESADVVILTAEALGELAARGYVVQGTRVDLVRSRIGMAVRAGAPRPDISSVPALVRALLQARSIAYSASASGTYLSTELFPRLGIAAQLQPKSRRIVSERVGAVIARGDAEMGFQQISELLPIDGIDVVGPIPDEVQRVTTFAAGITTMATQADAARTLLEFLASPAVLPAVRRYGLDPADAAPAPGPAAGSAPSLDQVRLVAPAAPGGGWDQTARVMQQVLQQSGLVRLAPVENIPGAAGTIGLARFIGAERGAADTLMVSGLIMLGAIVTHRSPVTLRDVTPLARLTGEYEVIAVPAGSPFRTLADVLAALRQRPESVSWGGGSAGGSDQILAGLVAEAAGVPARRVNYVAFSGGGESLSAIAGGQVSVGVNGLAELAAHIEAGTIRALAISSAGRLPGLDIPTLREQGVDVEFENWRSVVAPPGIDAEGRRRLEQLVARMVQSREWREALVRYRWLDRYLPGQAFERFSDEEEARVREILREFGTAAGEAGTSGSAGPYPLIVLVALLGTGAAAIAQIRRSPAAAVDRWPGWRPILLVATGAALNVVLAESAGFLVASAVLFWCTARAFDTRHPVRDAIFAVMIALGAFTLFARVLQLPLPAGVFARWL
jgi:putative tricarboxylic transport membrane protein